jgi:hypothetical protein
VLGVGVSAINLPQATSTILNGRNSDNTLIQEVFRLEPSTKLRDGMERAYRWIYDRMRIKQPAPQEV